MRPTRRLSLLLAGLLALSGGQPHPQLEKEGHANTSRQQVLGPEEDFPSFHVAHSNTDFALRFYNLLASESPERNIFFSPLSISAALAMLSLGAGGHSRAQMLAGLGFNLTELSGPEVHWGFRQLLRMLSLPSPGLVTRVGSALLLSQDLQVLPGFLNATAAFYDSKLFRLDFRDTEGTTQLINDHIKRETEGKISDLVSGLSPDVKVVLVNYLYFKGLWEKPFLVSKTAMRDFHVDENTTVEVPMMLQKGQHHWYLHDRFVPCSVLRLHYRGDAAALFILPDPGKMRQVEQALTPELLEKWNHLLQKRYFYKELELHLPKFSVSRSYALDQILPKMGFKDLFSHQANFSGITGQQKLWLSKSFHKATLDVGEAGTEAAAATSNSVRFFSARHSQRVLSFSRPFLLAIYSTNTRSMLFLGKVVNPTEP